MKKRILAVIPARLHSTRLPQKPLIEIMGKPLIERVYESVRNCPLLDEVIVATDNEKVVSCIKRINGNVQITSSKHLTGSDRVAEVVSRLYENKEYYDIVLNIQGDEPFINNDVIHQLVEPFLENDQLKMTTLKQVIETKEEVENPNTVKIVSNKDNFALYFSRAPIPHAGHDYNEKITYYKHIGLYGYTFDFIRNYSRLPQTPLEKIEKLEQLRILENNYSIYVNITNHHLIDINTIEDIKKAEKFVLKYY